MFLHESSPGTAAMSPEPYMCDPVFEALGINHARAQLGLPQLAPFAAGPPPAWSPPWWPGMNGMLGVPNRLPGGADPWPSAAWPTPELPKFVGSQGSTEVEAGDSDPSSASSPLTATRKVRVELNLAERTSPPEFRVDACGPPGPFFTPTKTRTSFRADAPVFVPREQDGFETPVKEEATANDEVRYVRSRMLRVRQYLEDTKGSNRDEGETSGKSLQWKTAKRSQVTAEHLRGAGAGRPQGTPLAPSTQEQRAAAYYPGLQPKVPVKTVGPQPVGRVL